MVKETKSQLSNSKKENDMNKGQYFSSPKKYSYARGKKATTIAPCIHVSGSIRGMRKLFWGYDRDVVRIGSYYYLQPFN